MARTFADGAADGVRGGPEFFPAGFHYVSEAGAFRHVEVARICVAVAFHYDVPVAPFAENALRRQASLDVYERVLDVPYEDSPGVAVRSPRV